MTTGASKIISQVFKITRVFATVCRSSKQNLQSKNPFRKNVSTLCCSASHPFQCPRQLLSSSISLKRPFHASPRLQVTKDPYAVLGIRKDASTSEIKKAYYGLAKKFHPDTSKEPNAKDRFAEAQSAYELLSDPQKKAAWDQFGAAAFDQDNSSGGPNMGNGPFAGSSPFGGGPSPGFSANFSGVNFGGEINFEDLFRGFTGASSGRRQRRSRSPFEQEEILIGDSIEVSISISFAEAAKGMSKKITINPLRPCTTCSGTGLKPGVDRVKCKHCDGTGTRIHFVSGGFQMASTCNFCEGQGVVIPRGGECRTCSGNGVTRQQKTINIDIPGGVEDGMRLRIDGEGDAPISGASSNPNTRKNPGDLYILVNVVKDPKFTRSGADILYTATIPLTTALLGGEIVVPTLSGDVKVKIATGTGTGDKITLTGRGMKKIGDRRNGFGDLKIEFKVAIPKYLSANQRAIIEMLADEFGDRTARRIMNVGKSSSSSPKNGDTQKNNGFLKSVWQKLTEQSDKPCGGATNNTNEGEKSTS